MKTEYYKYIKKTLKKKYQKT